jgi:hypothetical protein
MSAQNSGYRERFTRTSAVKQGAKERFARMTALGVGVRERDGADGCRDASRDRGERTAADAVGARCYGGRAMTSGILDPSLDVVFKLLLTSGPDSHEVLVALLTAVLRPRAPSNKRLTHRAISRSIWGIFAHIGAATCAQIHVFLSVYTPRSGMTQPRTLRRTPATVQAVLDGPVSSLSWPRGPRNPTGVLVARGLRVSDRRRTAV